MDEIQHDVHTQREHNGFQPAEAAEERPAPSEFTSRLADRLKRIDAHRTDGHGNPSRTAALRAISADLMEIEVHVAEAIRDAVVLTPMTCEAIEEYSPSIDLVLRLAKQISQVSQLEMRSSQLDG